MESNHRLLLMREAQEAISATATLVKPSVHQPASPPATVRRRRFLQVPHLYPCRTVYGHYPVSGYGLISLTVFMLKLRGQGRARTSDLRVNSHRILLIAVRLSSTKSHSIRRSKPSELPVHLEYILTFTVILIPIVVISID